MTQGKKMAISFVIYSALFAGNVSAFDQSFHPNHKFADRESIGPNFRSDLIIDEDKAAKVKTSEENLQIPSGVNPHNPSGANPNIRTGPDHRLYGTRPYNPSGTNHNIRVGPDRRVY